jgi:hypothetical protein
LDLDDTHRRGSSCPHTLATVETAGADVPALVTDAK